MATSWRRLNDRLPRRRRLPSPGTADPVEAARAALLPPGELGEIIGDTDVQQTATFTQPGQASAGIEPRDCAARLLFQEAVGADGYQGVVGDNNRGARGQSAAQLIQVFPETSPVWPQPGRQALRVAGNTVRMINDEQCREGVVLTTTAKDVTQHWTAGPVTAENPRPSRSAPRHRPRWRRSPASRKPRPATAITPSWPTGAPSSSRSSAVTAIQRRRPTR